MSANKFCKFSFLLRTKLLVSISFELGLKSILEFISQLRTVRSKVGANGSSLRR